MSTRPVADGQDRGRSTADVVVAVMDRAGFDANTDVIVVVRPEARQLLWVPRDLWCPVLGDRINAAYRGGGAGALRAALDEHELHVDGVLCLSRSATERALAGVRVVVPVPARLEFAYPLSPTAPIEDGAKRVVFEPPMAALTGERVHQWIGARGGSDLHRIARQAVLIWRLLDQRFDFAQALTVADAAAWWPHEQAVRPVLATVCADWSTGVLGRLEPETRAGKQVLVRRRD